MADQDPLTPVSVPHEQERRQNPKCLPYAASKAQIPETKKSSYLHLEVCEEKAENGLRQAALRDHRGPTAGDVSHGPSAHIGSVYQAGVQLQDVQEGQGG